MIKERMGRLRSPYDSSHRTFASKRKSPFRKVGSTDRLRRSRKNSALSRAKVACPRAVVYYRDVVEDRDVVESSYVVIKIHSFFASKKKERLTGPVQFISKLLKTWQLDPKDAVPLLGHEPSEMPYVLDLLNGRTALKGRDTKDRIVYLFHIRKTLSALFPSEEDENKWLRKPHTALEGQTPMQRLLEGSMENLLLVKEFVEEAAGR